MTRWFKVVMIPALILAFAGSVFPADRALADDFSKFIDKAKEKYEQYRSEVQDEIVVQEMRTSTSTGEMISENTIYRKGGKMRIDTKMQMPEEARNADMPQGMMSTVLYDGAGYWMVTPLTGKRKLGSHEAQDYRTEEYLWDLIPDRARMVGSETMGERDCYIVELTAGEDEPSSKVWMDKKTHVVLVVESGTVKGQEDRLVSSDFRKVEGGWEIPYKTEIFRGKRLISTLVVKSREVNSDLADDLFDPEKMNLGKTGTPDLKEMIQKQAGRGD
jgi:outer membrane lipoprotein-sorting protein